MTVRDADTLKTYFLLTKVPVPAQYNDLIDTIFAQGGGGSHDHDDLYVSLSFPNTISAVHTFNPTLTGSPFILGAKAQGQTVIGLRADSLNKSISAGNGLIGGGLLTTNIDLSVGAGDGITVSANAVGLTTPGTLSVSSTNNASGNHTHAITSSSKPGGSSSLLKTDSSGYLELIRLNVNTIADEAGGNLTISPAGDLIFNPTGNDVLPANAYDINLGAINKKYLTLHAAELWVETLVAQNTMATIGGRILVGPTTYLTQDFPIGATTIHVKHNEMASGDRAYLEANGSVEFIAITSGPTAESDGYYYTCSRNLDGSGANDWYAGDAVFNTGTTGDGFIDLYSVSGVKEVSDYGPTIVGNVRSSSTYNDWAEHWAIGNLNGLYGYSSTIYGAAFGKYANSESFLTIDSTNGIRMRYKDSGGSETTRAQWDISGNILIGQTGSSQDNIYISAGAISIRNNTTERIGLTAAGILTIKDSGGNAIFTFDASAGAEFTKPLSLASTGGIYQGTGTFASPTTGLKIYNSSGIGMIAGYNSGTVQWYGNTDGKLYAGAGAVVLDSDGLTLSQGDQSSNAAKWKDSGTIIAEIYAWKGTGIDFCSFLIPSIAATNANLNISALAPETYWGSITIEAFSGTENAKLLVASDSDGSNYIQIMGDDVFLLMPEVAAPSTPGSTTGALYVGTDGVCYFKNDANIITQMVEYTLPTSYAVTWAGSVTNPAIGNGTLSGRYVVIGKRVFLDIYVLMGTTTTYGSGNWSFSLPFPVASGALTAVGIAHLRDAGNNNYERHIIIGPSETVVLYFIGLDNGTNLNNITPTAPFTWGSGDAIEISVNYEKG